MIPLTLTNVLQHLGSQAAEMQSWQITDETQPDYGGLFNPDYGLADPKFTGHFIVVCRRYLGDRR